MADLPQVPQSVAKCSAQVEELIDLYGGWLKDSQRLSALLRSVRFSWHRVVVRTRTWST